MNKTSGFKCFGRDIRDYVTPTWWNEKATVAQSEYVAAMTSWRDLTKEAREAIVNILLLEMEIPAEFWDTKAAASLIIGIFKREHWAVRLAEKKLIERMANQA